MNGSVQDNNTFLEVDRVSKRFAQRVSWRERLRGADPRPPVVALDDVSFSVRSGEFFGLLGVNGAGKTTVMKSIATLLLPDQGSIRVGGLDTRTRDRDVRGVVAVCLANDRSLHWRLSARENLRLFAALHRVPVNEVEPRIETVLRELGLADASHRMVQGFSAGMIQRLLIGRALLSRPRLLLLDEPTRSLDPIAARDFRRFLREDLATLRNYAIVLATHDADEAFKLCDRVAVLHRGRILREGVPGVLAQEMFGDRCVFTVDAPSSAAFATLASEGRITPGETRPAADPGWWEVDARVNGGAPGRAAVVERLLAAGARVASCEARHPSLAEFLESVLGEKGEATR